MGYTTMDHFFMEFTVYCVFVVLCKVGLADKS